jgi:putative ABC transport system substrate-binding protein
VAIPITNAPANEAYLKETEVSARALGIELIPLWFWRADEFESTFRSITKERADAILVRLFPHLSSARRRHIVELIARSRLPALYEAGDWVEAGGLISYAPNSVDEFRRAAIYVDKILKGVRPRELPMERPTKFEMVVNLKTAKQIGLTIPPNVLARADKVIK